MKRNFDTAWSHPEAQPKDPLTAEWRSFAPLRMTKVLRTMVRSNFTKHIIGTVIGCALLAMVGCGSLDGLESSTSSSESQATSTGNPSLSIEFATTSVTASSSNKAVTASDTYCFEAMENDAVGSETQTCIATPLNYNLGILAIYLIDCQTRSGVSVRCSSGSFDHVASRVELYNDSQVDTEITADSNTFDGELRALTDDITVGGLQIVTAYIEQRFPSASDDADEAAKIVDDLQGLPYRICTTDDDEVDSTTMETRCGHTDATMGDYLVDLDDDGTWGFLDVSDSVTITEVSTRPSGYTFHDEHFEQQMVTFVSTGDEYTDGVDFYDTAGHFAPIMSLGDTEALSSASSYSFAVAIDIDDTFHWTDGADDELADANTCVQSISDTTCTTDSDSGSVGVYHPWFDNAFLPQVPTIEIEVAEE